MDELGLEDDRYLRAGEAVVIALEWAKWEKVEERIPCALGRLFHR